LGEVEKVIKMGLQYMYVTTRADNVTNNVL